MPIREYDASEYLETPEDIAEYLNVVMEEMSDDDDPRLLMMALRNVVKASGRRIRAGEGNGPESRCPLTGIVRAASPPAGYVLEAVRRLRRQAPILSVAILLTQRMIPVPYSTSM